MALTCAAAPKSGHRHAFRRFAYFNPDIGGVTCGLLSGQRPGGAPVFQRLDGRLTEVAGRAVLLDGGPPPEPDRPMVLQISRRDRLKDHLGVMQGFVNRVADRADAELMLARGPRC